MVSVPDDRTLIAQVLAKVPGAEESLCRRLSPIILTSARREISQAGHSSDALDPLDVVQAVLVVVIERLETFDTTRSIDPWVRGITKKCVASAARILRRAGADEEDDLLEGCVTSSSANPSRELRRQEITEAITRVAHQLPDDDRELLWRHHVDEVDLATLAAERGITPNNAAVRLARIRERLRQLLGDKSDYV